MVLAGPSSLGCVGRTAWGDINNAGIAEAAPLEDLTDALWRRVQAVNVDAVALGRLGQPEDVAAAIAFLASPDAAFVTGHGLVVDGGAMQSP